MKHEYTQAMLQKIGACSEERLRFIDTFGSSARISRANLRKAVEIFGRMAIDIYFSSYCLPARADDQVHRHYLESTTNRQFADAVWKVVKKHGVLKNMRKRIRTPNV